MIKNITAALFVAALAVAAATAGSTIPADYFPAREGHSWRYSGSMDYGRSESISAVTEKNGAVLVTVTGSVDDLSGGMAGDTSFVKKYIITPDEMRSEDGEILLKAPLKRGTFWSYTMDKGKKRCSVEIISVRGNYIATGTVITGSGKNGQTVFTVFKKGEGMVYRKSVTDGSPFELVVYLTGRAGSIDEMEKLLR